MRIGVADDEFEKIAVKDLEPKRVYTFKTFRGWKQFVTRGEFIHDYYRIRKIPDTRIIEAWPWDKPKGLLGESNENEK